MTRIAPRSALVRLAMIIVIAAGYYVTGRLGLLMAIPPGVATAVWPPSGIALAAVLLLGYDVWPGIWLGSFLVNSHILSGSDLPTTTAQLVAGTIGLGSTLQALLSAVLIRRLIGVRNPFDRARDVFKFIGIVALSCMAAATFGVTSSYLSGFAPGAVLEVNWFTWYLGDLAGAIVVTPLLLTWSKWLEFRLRSRRILEAVLMLVLLLVVSWALFGSGQFRDWLGAYTFIPFLIWAAFRFGQNGTALSALVVAGIAIWGTIQGLGPFVGETPNASLLSLQAFVCIATATGLLLSAALAERKQAEAALRGARDGLELRVQERTTQLDRANRDLQAEITERKRAYEVAEGRRIDLERELLVAHDVQASLIPRDMPDVPGFGLAGAWIPANEVAGDFYDIFPLPEGLWGIVIGDVADKGAAAVLYMAMVRSLILSAALRHRGPAAVLMEVNRTILIQYPEAMFATIFLAVFDPKQQTFQYANAGHNPPMVRCGSGPIESLTRTGTVVGMFAELELSEATITLGRGDAVILFTDGVTEAINPREEEYGADRLTAAITAAPRKASELLAHVEADLNAFTEGAPQHDDITFFVLTKD
ncbi:MAG TPA: MASE1 domain-containing protein [Anaerolineae bacterium]